MKCWQTIDGDGRIVGVCLYDNFDLRFLPDGYAVRCSDAALAVAELAKAIPAAEPTRATPAETPPPCRGCMVESEYPEAKSRLHTCGPNRCNLHDDCRRADDVCLELGGRPAMHCRDPKCMKGDCAKVNAGQATQTVPAPAAEPKLARLEAVQRYSLDHYTGLMVPSAPGRGSMVYIDQALTAARLDLAAHEAQLRSDFQVQLATVETGYRERIAKLQADNEAYCQHEMVMAAEELDLRQQLAKARDEAKAARLPSFRLAAESWGAALDRLRDALPAGAHHGGDDTYADTAIRVMREQSVKLTAPVTCEPLSEVEMAKIVDATPSFNVSSVSNMVRTIAAAQRSKCKPAPLAELDAGEVGAVYHAWACEKTTPDGPFASLARLLVAAMRVKASKP